MRNTTTHEKTWFNKLYRHLNAMPESVEIQVHNGHIQMNHKGAREEAFQARGDGDNADALDTFNTYHMRVYPCSESV